MKRIVLFIIITLPFIGFTQNSEYKIGSYKDRGVKAPNTHYIGEAWLNRLLSANENLEYNITKATFKANSTLNWHKHATPQVLIVVDGIGYYQERGNVPITIKEGDVIKCEKNVEHWHSSSKEHDVTYLAIYGGGKPTEWTQVLSQKEYDDVASKLKND
ncbi:cupin domain-containing protein [uncultured Croceitalea sp.]|uniref:cupin domain-containing protein n=1 Tax=uncultured Croceitalea sp. TaxID=1798908 RepID=UPI003305E119